MKLKSKMYIHNTCTHAYVHLYMYNIHITSVIVNDLKQFLFYLTDHCSINEPQ